MYFCVPQHGLKFIPAHASYIQKRFIHRQTTHLQLGQDFEFVTSQSVLATVSVSGHSETSVRRESVTTQDLKNQLVVTFP